jgi:hypothetical protein
VLDCQGVSGASLLGTAAEQHSHVRRGAAHVEPDDGDHGRFEKTYESTTAGVSIQTPQLDINTVAAGGGSCSRRR